MSQSIEAGGLITKDPDASRVYGIDWDKRALPPGATISTSSWAVTPSDGTLTVDSQSGVGTRQTQARFSGGTLGQRYTVTNHVVTGESPPQTDDCSFTILIDQT